MNKSVYEKLSKLSFIGGIISVFISLAAWFFAGGDGQDILQNAAAQRLGIFIGLWAPTMLALSTCLRHMAKDRD